MFILHCCRRSADNSDALGTIAAKHPADAAEAADEKCEASEADEHDCEEDKRGGFS